MPNYRRPKMGNTFFFTVVTHQRQPILCLDECRPLLRAAINDVKTKYPFTIKAWVLLPDHLHCIWEMVDGDGDFSKRWGMIKAGFTKRLNGLGDLQMSNEIVRGTHPTATASRVKRREGTVWQRRFWEHRIRDDRDFRNHCDYIHYNPVKHGLVRTAAEWP